ncbi:MAG: MBL fold metallo-hydrolase [Waddliaceae bacterium]|jgi:7,8-dihydropterin-6-yl-methyl-4-(beta-D-ribofuranosyl)aminobenzene 5'-phosphate synthase|nr:MBL fold metallo-hydrolase [Waddliaceae bacterium]MBT3578985.1 MBL fold metallo-hydrolase [Waddliaceae bacterium]MBT4444665.1 MBL fold metallo-hydrolase [Waddliaceae bacterium]MBT6929182.1 MBL fold metallo-hydrolase [Waddliaceae bacterium]MBT7265156.1 MBL fold metallo-hydrolase [Waddliaceae bacterium]
MKIDIVYDNEADGEYRADWGFSCFLPEHGIMFDVGANAEILSHNMSLLKISKENISVLVLSHDHWDHVGGLDAVLHKDLNVYVLSTFSTTTKEKIGAVAHLHECDDSVPLGEGIMTTGILHNDVADEQSLVIFDGDEGLVITACAHAGVGAVLDKAKGFGEISAILGGFHGFEDFDVLESMSYIGACHCTEHLKALRQRYPKTSHNLFAGKKLKFPFEKKR